MFTYINSDVLFRINMAASITVTPTNKNENRKKKVKKPSLDTVSSKE